MINKVKTDDERIPNKKVNIKMIKNYKIDNEIIFDNCTTNKKINHEKSIIKDLGIKNDKPLKEYIPIKDNYIKKINNYIDYLCSKVYRQKINIIIKINYIESKKELLIIEILNKQRDLKKVSLKEIQNQKGKNNAKENNISFNIYINHIRIKKENKLNKSTNLCNINQILKILYVLYVFVNFIRYILAIKERNSFYIYKDKTEYNKKIIKSFLYIGKIVKMEEDKKLYINYTNYSYGKIEKNNIIKNNSNYKTDYKNKLFIISNLKVNMNYELNRLFIIIFYIIKNTFCNVETLIYPKLIQKYLILSNKKIIFTFIISIMTFIMKDNIIQNSKAKISFSMKQNVFIYIKKALFKISRL